MIRHHVQKSAADAKRYYQAADYYTEGQDLQSALGGRAAALLGVEHSPEQKHFERLCDNLDPLTGQQLTQRMREDRIVGIDLTFDAPKSWSGMETLSPDHDPLAEARRRASLETMQELEQLAAVRERKGGRNENRTTGNLVWYRAEHDTTRPVDGVPDMQPHEHFFVLNATWDEADQQWKAANLYDIIRDMPYFQAAHNQRLARAAQELGYNIVRKGKSFELEGMPSSVTSKFSRRQQLIEQAAQDSGITNPKTKAELGAKTREHKTDDLSMSQLRRLWISRLTDSEQKTLAEINWNAKQRVADHFRDITKMVTPRQALRHAAEHVFERKSAAPVRELLAEALTYGVGGFSVEDAWKELEKDGRFTATVNGKQFVASRDVLAEERQLVKLARVGRKTLAAINPGWEIEDTRLNIGQRAGVHHLLGSKDFVTMVIGDAGAGKTTLLKDAKRAADAAGYKVFAFAPSAAASRDNLQAEGFEGAETVARLLVDRQLQEQGRGQIWLVDEAALLGTKETGQLFGLAKENGARLWIVGDDKQHRSVTRGSAFELLQKNAGITPSRVAENMRQKEQGYRKAVDTSKTKPADALDQMLKQEHVKEVPDAERYKLLAADYLEAVKPVKKRGKRKEPTALVIAPTHAEGAKVTAAIREGLKAGGKLGEEREFRQLHNLHFTEAQRKDAESYLPGDVLQFTQNAKGIRRGGRVELTEGGTPPVQHAARFQAFRPGTISLAKGDVVRVTHGGTSADSHRLDNGSRFTVAGFTKSGDLIDHRGWIIPADYGHLAHGYVTTSVSSQSKTVDRVLIAMGEDSKGAINREQLYVSISRGKEWARIYTDNAKALTHRVERTEERVSATELARLRRQERKKQAGLVRFVMDRRRRGLEHVPAAHVIDRQQTLPVHRNHVNVR